MKKIILILLVATLILSACGGEGENESTHTVVHFKAGFSYTCDYVTYEPGFVTLHWGDLSTSVPATEVDSVTIE